MSEKSTKQFWIFLIKDIDGVFENRVKNRKWPISSHTPNRKRICPDDIVVFYRAGSGYQKILGTGNTTSSIMQREGEIDYFVSLDNISIWKEALSIKPYIEKLDFIKNKIVWGVYMQGGVIKITKKDFELLSGKNK